MGMVVAVVVALAAGYLLGRVRPWRRLGDWAVGEFRFTGPWVLGGRGRQAVVILAHLLTSPRASWQIARASAAKTPPRAPVAVPVRDPDWAARRVRDNEGGTA
ncbi:hypothetical protein [Streptomyces sp. WAC08241]|uniref:hypothetical protein n=1 Tax=Streptomyces sp. WAC08241 TaxID=2487421 RepID=UPI000F772C9E|nr:hypothetical protein [Streptomyces sp. WAC08241]RSS37117.1 hypothetical protein EF906_23785 [Streptomyces sp. WAC08241]